MSTVTFMWSYLARMASPALHSARRKSSSMLAAAWCRSVGSTWTLELREMDDDPEVAPTAGPPVDWISSGVPTTLRAPGDNLAAELLAERGLAFYPRPDHGPVTRSRGLIGYAARSRN